MKTLEELGGGKGKGGRGRTKAKAKYRLENGCSIQFLDSLGKKARLEVKNR